eukprot:6914615-Karenia_brevis.AAC.1
MCDKQSPSKSGNVDNKAEWDSHQSKWQYDQSRNELSTWQPDDSAQPPPPPPPPPSDAKASNPQEDPQMRQEMSWDAGDN